MRSGTSALMSLGIVVRSGSECPLSALSHIIKDLVWVWRQKLVPNRRPTKSATISHLLWPIVFLFSSCDQPIELLFYTVCVEALALSDQYKSATLLGGACHLRRT